ncbi:MAG: glycerate kinase, partial [Acholeplasmataceae bacterium]|nr:glycerate kinase [Acholeplasmataceae bacterium]
ELILHAIDQGVKKIILGLGGSATNDGGAGFATALGVQFFDEQNRVFVPVGGTLSRIKKIDVSHMDERLKEIEFVTMCDIDNPLFGYEGAAYIFSPQKGADAKMVEFLDKNLMDYAEIVKKELNFNDPYFKGAGAAGGLGYGTKVFLNSKIQMGIETVLDVMHFDSLAKDVDYIITGEGSLDLQSLRGKVVIGVARRAKNLNTKVIAVVGQVLGDQKLYIKEGIDYIVVTNYLNLPFEEVKKRAELDMIYTFKKFLETIV